MSNIKTSDSPHATSRHFKVQPCQGTNGRLAKGALLAGLCAGLNA